VKQRDRPARPLHLVPIFGHRLDPPRALVAGGLERRDCAGRVDVARLVLLPVPSKRLDVHGHGIARAPPPGVVARAGEPILGVEEQPEPRHVLEQPDQVVGVPGRAAVVLHDDLDPARGGPVDQVAVAGLNHLQHVVGQFVRPARVDADLPGAQDGGGVEVPQRLGAVGGAGLGDRLVHVRAVHDHRPERQPLGVGRRAHADQVLLLLVGERARPAGDGGQVRVPRI
jgi:hypothetical protein